MKKILFFLSTIFLLSACSNDNDPISSSDVNEAKYAVSLNAELPVFQVESSSLKNVINDGEPIVYSLVIYKENGEVYYNWFYDALLNSSSIYPFGNGSENINIFSFDGTKISTSMLLPTGSYHIALLIHRQDAKHPNTTLYPIISPHNYDTDAFGSDFVESDFKDKHNGGVYFNTADLTVEARQKEQSISMELKPMWSYIDINIEDAQTFDAPEGTNALQFDVNPLYYGFNLKTKLAPFADTRPIIVSLDEIRKNTSYNLRTTVSKSILPDNTISAEIKYLKIENDTTVLETKKLPIPNSTLENGYTYNIHGALGRKNPNPSFNISLGSFAKEDVVIDF